MSIRQKIVDGARVGLNTLLVRVAADDTPLSHVDEAELQLEHERRLAARKGVLWAPTDNPRARWAGGSARARAERQREAKERHARVVGARETRFRSEKAARERAFRDAQASARRAESGSRSAHRRGAPRSPLGRTDARLAQHYKTLNLTYGAPFAEVKKAYRDLIRRYHPDLHGSSAKKQKAATELTTRFTQAYNELEVHLTGGPNKGKGSAS